MTIAKSIRLLLAGVSACIVVWAFMTVIARAVRHWSSLQERPIELTILHWGDPAENRIVTDLVEEYQKLNPKVKIIDIHASDMRSKLKTMLAAGTPPDLFYLPPDLLPELAELKLIRAIDDDLKQDFSENGQVWFDDYFPILIDAFRYNSRTHEIGSGPLYGLPKDFTPSVFYINIDLFEKAGIDWKTIQKNGWTTDEFEDSMRKIRALNESPEFKDRNIYGGVFEIWPDTLRQILWMFDGEFFGKNPDGTINFRDVTLDSPASQEALEFIVRLRLKDKTVFNATGIAKDGAQEFVNGNIGCAGPVGRWKVPRFTSDMKFKWDVLPLPFKKGVKPSSQVYYTAWTATQGSKYPHEAFKLMKFLCGPGGAVQQSRLGLAIPPLKSVAYSPDFLSPPGIPQHNAQLFLDWIKHAKLQQVPREAEWTRIVGDKITDAIQLGEKSTMQSAQEIETTWMNELNSPLRTREWSPMRWDVIGTIAAVVIAIFVVIGIVKARKEKLGPIDRAHERTGYAFILPWLIGFLALTAGPMVVSMLLSFTKWSAMTPMGSAEAVGIANYKQLFFKDPTFLQSLKVTGYFVLLSVPVSQVTALLVAMLMNLRIKGIGVFRTVYFVPSVVGMVAMSMLALQVFNNDYGILNQILWRISRAIGETIASAPTVYIFCTLAIVCALLGRLFVRQVDAAKEAPAGNLRWRSIGAIFVTAVAWILAVQLAIQVMGFLGYIPHPPDWFGLDARVWAIPGFVIIGLWGVGGGMIIYLAGLKGIPVSLYEAATIDGAGPLRKFWNVTLPMLSPLIFYNFVMGLIGSFQVFTQAYIMTGAGPGNATLFYVLQLYRQAFEFHNMGYASAMAWVLFVICLVLTLIVFRGSKNLVYYEGLK